MEGELYAGLVLSKHAHANITVDPSAALKMEGVVDYVCVNDVPGNNIIGLCIAIAVLCTCTLYKCTCHLCTGLGSDEPVFADEKVIHFGQIIGVILAKNQALAQRAAKAVKVTYKDIEPAIITIEVSFEFIVELLEAVQNWVKALVDHSRELLSCCSY